MSPKSTGGLRAIPRASGSSKTNFQNFSFEPEDEKRLTGWMASHFEYSIYPYDGDIDELEKKLIRAYEPPLNLTGWKNPQKPKIQQLRNACKAEAKLKGPAYVG